MPRPRHDRTPQTTAGICVELGTYGLWIDLAPTHEHPEPACAWLPARLLWLPARLLWLLALAPLDARQAALAGLDPAVAACRARQPRARTGPRGAPPAGTTTAG